MSDFLKRTIAGLLGCAGIAYIGRMLAQKQTFVIDAWLPHQLWVGIALIALFLIFVVGLALKPFALKRLKWRVVAYGLVMVLVGHYLLIDNAATGMYAGDVVTLLGVLIFFLALAGALITKKVQKSVEQAMQQVIEV